jgi:hypothetical protein
MKRVNPALRSMSIPLRFKIRSLACGPTAGSTRRSCLAPAISDEWFSSMPARAQPCSWRNGSSRVFLPRHKSVPDDSCAYHALLGGLVEKGRETWAIPKLPMCEVEAMGMPTGDSMDASLRAVAILRPYTV